MKMKTRPTKWTVYPEGDEFGVNSINATEINIVNECQCEIVEVTQGRESIQIHPDEWPEIWNAIGTAIKQIIENEN